ncbi:MAG TPA: hypothetical protein VKR61_20760 [Bryobacteraceae bacterium]|nr:hypothetical protein [Bryobacteraceae bacterium]
MKKLLLVALGFALSAVAGYAAPCAPGTLASYIAMGPGGCVLGNLVVGNFAYHAKASGGAPEITSDQIQVTPLLAPVGAFALQFAAPWSVQTGQIQISGITYNVASPAVSNQVQQATLDGAGFQGGMFSRAVVNQALATPAATDNLEVFLKCTEVCRSQTTAMVAFTPGAAVLAVSDRVALDSKLGNTSITGFTNWFIICIPCV